MEAAEEEGVTVSLVAVRKTWYDLKNVLIQEAKVGERREACLLDKSMSSRNKLELITLINDEVCGSGHMLAFDLRNFSLRDNICRTPDQPDPRNVLQLRTNGVIMIVRFETQRKENIANNETKPSNGFGLWTVIVIFKVWGKGARNPGKT